jgi:hypothetical protein
MSTIHVLYLGNDTVLQLDALQNDVSGEYLDHAEVLVTLTDDQGNEISGAAWPKSMVHVAGTRGMYRVTLPYSLDLVTGRRYTALLAVDAGPGLHAEWELECVARSRN